MKLEFQADSLVSINAYMVFDTPCQGSARIKIAQYNTSVKRPIRWTMTKMLPKGVYKFPGTVAARLDNYLEELNRNKVELSTGWV